jgi:YD repeat-containing protein
MKRIIALTLALLLFLSACGNPSAGDGKLYVLTAMDTYTADNIHSSRTEFVYDELGRMIQKTFYSPETESIWNEEQGFYEAKVIGIQSEPFYVQDFAYQGTLLASESGKTAYNASRSFEYVLDDQGVPVGFNNLQMIYDEDGRLIRVGSEEITYQEYEYDDQGRLIREYTYGMEVSFQADFFYEEDRLVRRDVYTANSVRYELTSDFLLYISWNYEYDNRGRLTGKNSGDGTYDFSYTYDSKGRIVSFAAPDAQGECEYDEKGNLSQVTLADGTRIEYTYEAMEVPAEYAEAYRIWFFIRNRDSAAMDGTFYKAPHYPMIPNPLWEIEPVIPR